MRVRFYSRVKAEAALNAPTRPLKPLMQVELEQDASQPLDNHAHYYSGTPSRI